MWKFYGGSCHNRTDGADGFCIGNQRRGGSLWGDKRTGSRNKTARITGSVKTFLSVADGRGFDGWRGQRLNISEI